MSNIVIRSLYRNKLRECVRLGYAPGNWDSSYITNNITLTKRQIRSLSKKNKLGNYIFNNVRHQYKNVINFELLCQTEKNELLDDGFSSLRAINELSHRSQYHTLGLL